MNKYSSYNTKIENEIDPSGSGSLRPALGFCALGLAAAILAVPLLNGDSKTKTKDQFAASNVQTGSDVDKITTGAVSKPRIKKRFTISRSVLQRDPKVACITYDNGTQEGGC